MSLRMKLKAARLVIRVDDIDQTDEIVGVQVRRAFEAERILDAAHEFDLRAVELFRARADPQKVRGGIVPVAGG